MTESGASSLEQVRAAALDAAVGAYDIRGRIPDQLDDDILFALGWATATTMAELHGSAEVVVGHDMRPSSPGFARAFAAGIAASGSEPILLGLCSTDQLYFASGIFDLPGAMITASHNPADYNGIKICGPRAAGVSLTSGLGRIRRSTSTRQRPNRCAGGMRHGSANSPTSIRRDRGRPRTRLRRRRGPLLLHR
jgi:phosphomannomutase